MKTRQRNLRIFELEANLTADEYIDFIQKHLPLLKQHTIAFTSPIDSSVREFLIQHNIHFSQIINHTQEITLITHENPKEHDTHTAQSTLQDSRSQENSSCIRVIDRRVRSGEEIYHRGDLIVQSQVHSGAHIITEGNLYLLDECSGSIEVRGEILLCTKILAPAILFQGELLDEDFLHTINQSRALFTMIFKKGDMVFIKPLTKDEYEAKNHTKKS